MIRTLIISLAFVLAAGSVRAQTCATTFANFSQWTPAALPAPTETDPALGVREQMQSLADVVLNASGRSYRFPSQGKALTRVASFLEKVLRDYDSANSGTAKALALSDLQPRPCPSALGADGIPGPTCSWETLLEPAISVPPPEDNWDCAFQTEFAGYIRAANDLLNAWNLPLVHAAAKKLARADDAWTSLINSGYSQFPWEVWVNGLWIDKQSWAPNRNFMILLHPALGLGVDNLSHRHREDPAAVAILSLQALGYLHYFSNHKQYVGAGFVGTLGNLQWKQRALGLVAHYSGFSLGVSRGFWADNDKEWTVFWLVDVGRSMDDNFLAQKIPKIITDRTLRH